MNIHSSRISTNESRAAKIATRSNSLYLHLTAVCLSIFLALVGTVSGAPTITVQNVNDSGPGSLRQAVLDAASLYPSDTTTINFDSKLLHQVILLTSGAIALQGKVIILGPGADLLTISGNHHSRIFTIPASATSDNSIYYLTLADGFAPGQSGGHGGAILSAGSLQVVACALVGNSVAGSSAGDAHGGAIENSALLVVDYCTFDNNSAQGGGAIYNAPAGDCYVRLCTFTKNSVSLPAGGGGGGAILHRGKSLSVTMCTIADNTADGAGGGLYTSDVPQTSSEVQSTIVALNHAPNSPDTYGAYSSDGYNLIGISNAGNGFTAASDRSGTPLSPLNPKLAALSYNGGGVQTMALESDSPAVDQGYAGPASKDQRLLPRKVDYPGVTAHYSGGDSSDIGAFELQLPPPTAETTDATEITGRTAQLNAFVNANGSETNARFEFGLNTNYTNGTPLKSIGGSTQLLGFNAIISGLTPGATYHFRIVATNPSGTTYGDDKAFTTQVAAITVQNSNDSGPGSLRQAVLDAHSLYPSDETAIDFIASMVHQTIVLSSGPIEIQSKILVSGPGADLLTVSGNHHSRIFTVPAGVSLNLRRLTLAGGFDPSTGGGQNGGHGGAILSAGSLTAYRCAFEGNSVGGSPSGDGHGGAIENSGLLTLLLSTFNINSAQGGGAVYNGPGSGCYSTLCTFTNNSVSLSTGAGGGAILHRGKFLFLSQCTIADNTANGAGGGIYFEAAESTSGGLDNNIIALNHAPTSPDTYGACYSTGYNLVGVSDAANGFTKSTDHSGTVSAPLDPKLISLADNGGSVQTMALQPDSPAIDQGRGGLGYDQRGFPRPVDYPEVPAAPGGNNADIGAFELESPTVTPTPTPTPVSTTLANISTRLRVETGDSTLIGGFIVTGTQPKKVIIRAIGPSLGLSGQLANPTLELYTGQTLLGSNDNWVDSPDKQAIIDSTIPPANDLESAIVATLPANGAGYTAVVRGFGDTTGIAVVQVYDLDSSVDSKLANISTRGLVQTGDNVLIAGTIVLGQSPQKVIIRATGPSLNIAGELFDPTLQLVNADGAELAFNDNWRTGGQEAEIIATGVPPTNDAESAIVFDLPANGANYTAIVRGANETTGIAVVEVYALN